MTGAVGVTSAPALVAMCCAHVSPYAWCDMSPVVASYSMTARTPQPQLYTL